MAELESRKSEEIFLDYEKMQECAQKIQKCGEKYQNIADVFKTEIRNLKQNKSFSSKFIDCEFENIIAEAEPVLNCLQTNCNEYAEYINNVIRTFRETDH